MSDGTLAIEVRDLRKTYRDGWLRRRRVQALGGVSLQVARGRIFGLLGPNGAGKTTLIKILLGIVRRTAGDARLLGFPAGDRRGRAGVGYLPESHRIPQHLTGNTALEYYGQLSGISLRQVRSVRSRLLQRVGLGRWGTTSVRKYSKGMLQRLGLAQAMLHDPPLLILDEPTDGVDPIGRSEMRELLQELRGEGKTIFINSHLLQEVELVCDQVAIMHRGKLVHVGTVDELTRQSHGQVDVRVVAAETQLAAVLETVEGARQVLVTENVWQVELPMQAESEIDRYIDLFRRADISIRTVTPRRRTLEQAFLDIIQGAAVEAELIE